MTRSPPRKSPGWTILGTTGPSGGNRHDLMLGLIQHHRGVRQKENRRRRCDGHTKARELAGREEQIGIRHGGARVDRSARTVEGVVDEIERALPAKVVSSLRLMATLSASGPGSRARSREKVR